MKRHDEASGFWLTPHKVSQCILLTAYVAPGRASLPFLSLSPSVRHRLGLFLLYLTKASNDFTEPSLEELGRQLKNAVEVGELLVEWLRRRLGVFVSPEDMFAFFLSLRELLAPVPYVSPETSADAMLLVEHSSLLGQFLRRCILSFNILTFEGICRILTELDAYREPIRSRGLFDKTINMKICEEDDMMEDNSDTDAGFPEIQSIGAAVSGDGSGGVWEERQLRLCKWNDAALKLKTSQNVHRQQLIEMSRAGGLPSPQAVQCGGDTLPYAFGTVTDRGDVTGEGRFLRTHGQVEAYLKEQASLIEKEVGSVTNQASDQKLILLEKLAPGMPRVHYLRYLAYLHRGDYSAALDSLHRYYDYSAGRGGVLGASSSDASHGRFQAGLLGLGSMHAQLGNVSQGLQALNEAVHIAQQHNDDECLAHALAASYDLLSKAGFTSLGAPYQWVTMPIGATAVGLNGAIQQHTLLLLSRCLQRALELKLPHLVAFSRLALSSFDLKSLRSTSCVLNESPKNIFSVPATAKHVNYRPNSGLSSSVTGQMYGTPGNLLGAGAGWPTLMSNVGHTSRSVLRLAGTAHLLRAASWEVYGSGPLVRVSSLVHATCYSNVASADDHALAYIKLAQHLASFRGFKVALSAMEVVASKFDQSAKTRVRATQLELLHDQALSRGAIKSAQMACGELSALASPVVGVNLDMKMAASYQHIRGLIAAGQFVEAAVPLQVLFSLCCKAKMQIDSIPVLLLMANMYKEAGSPVSGIPYVLASLTLSRSYGSDLLNATGFVTLAELWLGLGVDHAQQALSLLEHCLPMVRGYGGLHLRARANLAIARCHLSNGAFSVLEEPETVFEPLLEAAKDFDLLECYSLAAEAHYLLALLFNAVNKFDERNKAALAFQSCIVQIGDAQNARVDGIMPKASY